MSSLCLFPVRQPVVSVEAALKLISALDDGRDTTYFPIPSSGGHSSMVESKLVELVVAGSNPVGHPTSLRKV